MKCIHLGQQSLTLLAPGTSFMEDNFSMDWGGGGWFWDDSSALHYCALYFYYYYIARYNEISIQLTIMLTGAGAQVVM